ncbi:MAG: beta-lactamase family protein, partial [Acidobacteriota bacterium]
MWCSRVLSAMVVLIALIGGVGAGETVPGAAVESASESGDEAALDSIQALRSRLEGILEPHLTAGELNGAALVVRGGSPVLIQAYGQAHAEWDVPNTRDTRFDLFSMTKSFTAILVLQLVREGKIDLDFPITAYLPFYRKDTGARVSIHHLLSHTHGIPDIGYDRLPVVLDATVPEFLAAYASGDLQFIPGSRFAYSGLAGYTILGAIIQEVTGESYEQVLAKRIIEPLGLADTGFISGSDTIPRLATSYVGTTAERRTYFFRVESNGASSIFSSVEDLHRWFEAVVAHRLLSPELTEAM